MGWYQAGLWSKRAAISVDNNGTSPADVDVVIPREWDDFWTTIDSSGNELRAVWYDSQTLLSYSVDNGSGGAFSKTNRNGRIRIDGMTVPATAGCLLIWLYYGSTSTQGSAAVATVIAASRTGSIELGRPGLYRLEHSPQTPGLTRPRVTFHKTATEQIDVWIRYDKVLQKRVTPGNSAGVHEEPWYLTQTVESTAGADQAGMRDITPARWVWWRGQMWAKVRVLAGTSGTNYTGTVLTRTVLPGASASNQGFETRFGLSVQDSRLTS